MKEQKRFEAIYTQKGLSENTQILKDTQTGVCYLFVNQWQYGGGLTPLLDSDGKPIVDQI